MITSVIHIPHGISVSFGAYNANIGHAMSETPDNIIPFRPKARKTADALAHAQVTTTERSHDQIPAPTRDWISEKIEVVIPRLENYATPIAFLEAIKKNHEDRRQADLFRAVNDIGTELKRDHRVYAQLDAMPSDGDRAFAVMIRLRAAMRTIASKHGPSAVLDLGAVPVYFGHPGACHYVSPRTGRRPELRLNNDFSEQDVVTLLQPYLNQRRATSKI